MTGDEARAAADGTEPTRDAPADLRGRVFLVTGASTGIGRAVCEQLAARGATLWLAGRSAQRTAAARDQIAAATGNSRLRALTLDLGDLDSVRRLARELLAADEPLHCLINNAGIAGPRGVSASGFEVHFGVNHVGTFLLTALLCDRLRASAPARIVNVSSEAHRDAPGIDWEAVRRPTRTLTGMREYGVSKLANILHARELALRLAGDGVSACSVHPGVVASDIWRRVPWPVRPLMKLRMISPAEGARPVVHCATAPELPAPGAYHVRMRPQRPGAAATDELAAELWERSESWVRPYANV
ncbi:MAG TPA: SDR family oxidoreductase [Solirubrobacteraceae bacterium]|nr:SDR family oxidoreductase [Solirubrobacteraceae bacterium]